MKIERIDSYRDGGSISIILSEVDEKLLESLGLPTKPKHTTNGVKLYEVFRNFSIGSKDKNNYFFGDINGEFKQLYLDNHLLKDVKVLLEKEKINRGLYQIEKFLFSL